MIIDSNCGSCIIPITNGVGLYRIDFISQGATYIGYFIIN